MAKIVLVSQELHNTTWSLATALRAQNHEVIIITSKNQSPPTQDSDINVLTYFKNWSVFEALKITPVLVSMNPQIIHFLLDNDTLNSAQTSLALIAKALPDCVLTTSLLNIERGLHKRNLVRYLLQESDIVTCPTTEAMGHLRGLTSHKNQGRGILPPVLDLREDLRKHTQETHLQEWPLIENLQNTTYVVIPFREIDFNTEDKYFKRLLLIAERYHVVLWGGLKSWPPRKRRLLADWFNENKLSANWTITGEISAGTTEVLLENAEALILAGQEFTPVEMTEMYLKAINTKTTLVLSRRQAQVHAALWQHGNNCWILSERKFEQELKQMLNKVSLKTPEHLPESIARNRQWIDVPLNDLNRLYNKALMSK